MQERHLDRARYFSEQSITTSKYVIPYVSQVLPVTQEISVLEIGCGEGGNLMPFLEIGCARIVGVDMAKNKIENARAFYKDHPKSAGIEFIAANIYDIDDLGQFDLIITRDVLEHIHGQEAFMEHVKKFLKPCGKFFLGFPPFNNPFGGHQQICESKILSKLPFFHLLPMSAYKWVLKTFGESAKKIENLLEIKETGITIERFEGILKRKGYKKDKTLFYFINPNYEIKFKLKPREQLKMISSIPYVRNFLITTNYYIVSPEVVAKSEKSTSELMAAQ
jgi:2-polyprenyl-3-methyl-5-hydroxy-6-metoxy-1,4-benzoquinol methylase